MSDRDKALRVVAIGVLKETVKDADSKARQELYADMRTGDRLTADYAGQVLGAVTMAKGRVTPTVSDPDAFAAWVAEHYPTEVVHKPVVRESFKAAVLEASRKAGEPCTPDGTLGVPGVTVNEGDPYLQVRTTNNAGQIVACMVADGYLTADGELKQIEGGVDE